MVPTVMATSDEMLDDFATLVVAELPTYTYALDLETKRVQGFVDGQAAMRQAIFKILQTERYDHPEIYSDNYGVELRELIGQPIPYVLPEAERRISEALLWDERITNVYGFEFDVNGKVVAVSFTATTIFGDIEIETEVNI